MKKSILYFTLAALISLTSAFTFKKDTDLKYKLEHLSGTYADAKPYNYGKAWGKRVFTFDNGKWTLVFTLGLDPELKMQVFQFRTVGNYKLEEKSTKLENTYNAVFYEAKKFLTLKTADANLIKAFGFVSCGMTKDIEIDVSEKGCSGWKSVAECPGDYDLLSLDAKGLLYFGDRPADNDMCSADKRPTKLTPPVTKMN